MHHRNLVETEGVVMSPNLRGAVEQRTHMEQRGFAAHAPVVWHNVSDTSEPDPETEH